MIELSITGFQRKDGNSICNTEPNPALTLVWTGRVWGNGIRWAGEGSGDRCDISSFKYRATLSSLDEDAYFLWRREQHGSGNFSSVVLPPILCVVLNYPSSPKRLIQKRGHCVLVAFTMALPAPLTQCFYFNSPCFSLPWTLSPGGHVGRGPSAHTTSSRGDNPTDCGGNDFPPITPTLCPGGVSSSPPSN